MYKALIILAIILAGYFAYDKYGYRYVISNVVKEADSGMSMGSTDPDINVIAYVDYDSVSSRRIYPVLLNLVASDQNVRVHIRPIDTGTKRSELATRVALAAKVQGQFMSVNNVFLTSNSDIDERYMEGAIRSLGLNYNRLKYDISAQEVETEIQDLKAEAGLLNITQFPFLFVEHVKMSGASYTVNDIKGVIKDLRSGRL